MTENLQKILKEIEVGKRNKIYSDDLTVEELLFKNRDGITVLEYIFSNNIKFDYYGMIEKIKNNVEIGYIFCKYNKGLFFFEFNEEALFSNINGQIFIEFLTKNGGLTSSMVSLIKNHIEIIDIIISHKNEYNLSYLSSEIVEKLMIKNKDGIYLIEKYLNNDGIISKLIPLINDFDKLMEICTKYNKFNLLKKINEKMLMSNYNESETILHYLISEKNIVPDVVDRIPKNLEFVKFLVDNNYYENLANAGEDVLLFKIKDEKTLLEILIEKGYISSLKKVWKKEIVDILNRINKLDLIKDASDGILLGSARQLLGDNRTIGNETLLEYMLDNGYNPLSNNSYISNEMVVDILYKKERPDLLTKVDIEKLLKQSGESETYFDYLLENIKQKKIKFNIRRLHNYSNSVSVKAKFYLMIAKHNMMGYIDDLTEKDLLKKYGDKTLLDEMLDLDVNLTLNKVLTNGLKSKINISAILSLRGIEQDNVDVSLEKNEFSKEYLESIQSGLGYGPMLMEGELLIRRLQELFISDGKSNKELINVLISGYRNSLIINYEINIKELRNLIAIKEQNLDKFCYIKHDNGSYFSKNTGAIYCDSIIVDTLLHETGHALHYYLADNFIPENYQEVIQNAKSNPEMLRKVEDYANKIDGLRKKIRTLVEQKSKTFFASYYDEERMDEVRKLLLKSKSEKKDEFRVLGIPEESLDIILETMFTEDEYILHQKRIFINENTDAVLRSEFGALMAIGDILDAIYEGELFSNVLENSQGQKIKRIPGHGISYYCATSHGFDEMVANFASISKSKDSVEMLQLFKSIVGDELYNMLSDFYYHNLVESKEEQFEELKTFGGK